MKTVNEGRREVLKTLGFAAIAGAGVTVAGPAFAQLGPTTTPMQLPTTQFQLPRQLQVSPEIGQLNLVDTRAIAALRLGPRFPDTTPVAQMGLSPASQAMLSPAALTLTKADLVALGQGRTTPAAQRLTVQDVQSVRAAFMGGFDLVAADINCCCCCCPCCCAAAVDERQALAA